MVHGDGLGDHVDVLAPAQRLDLADAEPEPRFTGKANRDVPVFAFGRRRGEDARVLSPRYDGAVREGRSRSASVCRSTLASWSTEMSRVVALSRSTFVDGPIEALLTTTIGGAEVGTLRRRSSTAPLKRALPS